MRSVATLLMSDDVSLSVLSPVFQRESRAEKIEAPAQQQQQYDRYAHLSESQLREVIRQQQM